MNPPDNPSSSVWVQRFPDGQSVETATGFGSLNSSQIAFSSGPQAYTAQAHAAMAALMLAAEAGHGRRCLAAEAAGHSISAWRLTRPLLPFTGCSILRSTRRTPNTPCLRPAMAAGRHSTSAIWTPASPYGGASWRPASNRRRCWIWSAQTKVRTCSARSGTTAGLCIGISTSPRRKGPRSRRCSTTRAGLRAARACPR